MNSERLEALLWTRIDGTINPEELAELEAHLTEYPEPPEIERQIMAIANGLRELESEQPPSELRGRIDSALDNATPPKAHPSGPSRVHEASSWRTRWLPLAASLLIGVAIGYLMRPGVGGSIDRAEVAGSMLTSTEHLEPARAEIVFDGGTIIASRSGADTAVDLTLTEAVELGVTLAGADGPVRLVNLNSSTPSGTEITTEEGWVVLRTRGPGAVVLTVSASTPGDPLRLQVSSDGLLVEERWIGPVGNEAGE
jgi:anti-sigma factor RsiW